MEQAASTDSSDSPAVESVQTGPTQSPEDSLTQSALPVESIIYYVYNNGLLILSQYGWYVLFIAILGAIGWYQVKPHYYRWRTKRDEWLDERNFDPVKAERDQDAMLRAREKMQQELDEKALRSEKKKEEKESEERNERIKQWEEFKVVSTAKRKTPRDDGNRKRPAPRRDYFPLGDGGRGGGGYRPPRRMAGGGG